MAGAYEQSDSGIEPVDDVETSPIVGSETYPDPYSYLDDSEPTHTLVDSSFMYVKNNLERE